MNKSLTKSDLSVRTFKTFKKWTIATVESGSNPRFNLSLDTRVLPLNEIKVLEGISGSGPFFPIGDSRYNSDKNPINWDGSYKSIIYSTYNHLFYENALENPLNTFGVEFPDETIDGKSENRFIKDRIVVTRIPQTIFGEKIRPYTVDIFDESDPHSRYHIKDDGYTNLVMQNAEFSNVQEIDSTEVSLPKSYYVYDPSNDRFGTSVSAWTEYIVVGSPMDDDSFAEAKSGAAYLYKYDFEQGIYRFIRKFYSPFTQVGLTEELYIDDESLLMTELGVFLLANGFSLKDRFGIDISVNENFLAIGSPRSDLCAGESERGAVYVYDKYKGGADHWGIINIIEGPSTSSISGSAYDFGFAVSINTSSLAVGAPGAYGQKGAVYIFNRKTYAEDYSGSFWYEVKEEECATIILEDESLLFDERPIPFFVTGNNTFEFSQIITASDGQMGDRFGGCLKLSGSKLIVGNDNFTSSGSVYLFENISGSSGSWSETVKFTGNEQLTGELSFFNTQKVFVTHSFIGFGNSVSIDQDIILIGSPSDEWYYEYACATTLYKEGAVYVYKQSSSAWNFVDKIFSPEKNSESNLFGYSVDVKVPNFIVGSLVGKQKFSSSYTDTYLVEDSQLGATGSGDESNVNGRSFFYRINTVQEDSGSIVSYGDCNDDFSSSFVYQKRKGDYDGSVLRKEVKRNKLKDKVKQDFGFDVAITDKIGVVGAPAFFYSASSTVSGAFFDQNMLRLQFSSSYHGSAYIYRLDDLNKNWNIGNVFYKNGIFVTTSTESLFKNIMNTSGSSYGYDMSFQGTQTIYEHEILCSVEPGEFNVSTNPSSVVRKRILFDVNNDGFFDENDLDLLIRFIVEYSENPEMEEEHGFINEQDDDWWNNSIIITESEDVLFINSLPFTNLTREQRIMQYQNIDQDTFDYINFLLLNGFLDINDDGHTDIIDAKILFNYFIGRTGYKLLKNIHGYNPGSEQRTPSEILEFLNDASGKNNGILIKGDFLNYVESSSFDKTGSFLAPYITTIGLYSDDVLVGVAKLGKPVKSLIDYPINFSIKYDS